jgi:hypothetical protein
MVIRSEQLLSKAPPHSLASKIIPFPFVRILLVAAFIQMAVLLYAQENQLDFYKSGPIHLTQDPDFGKNTDWKNLFYHRFCDLTVAPDGSLFIASSRQHKIFKFDPDGNLIKTFGQKGKGPGDFNMPGDLSVLDGKFLVVGEYASEHRISLFDLEGNFKKVLKTGRPPFSPLALRGSKIAYIAHRYRGEGQTDRKIIESVVVRDINSDREVEVAEFTFTRASIMLRQGSLGFGDYTSGEVFIASTKEGSLLVGNTLSPSIDVYSPDGTMMTTIQLDIETIPVTKRLINQYKKYHIDQFSKESLFSRDQTQDVIKQLKKASWDHMFVETLPLYLEFLVDEENNILVFRRTDCLGDACPILIRVYSPDGKFICETEMMEGPFELTVDSRIKNMCFTRQGLITMVEVKDAAEFELRVIKMRLTNREISID